MFVLSNKQLKIIMINMLRSPMKMWILCKTDGNISRKREILKKKEKQMLEIKSTVTRL